jgi:hypothetical protein
VEGGKKMRRLRWLEWLVGIGIFFILLALFAVKSASGQQIEPLSITIGDLNGDNTLDLGDVQLSLTVALGLETLPPEKVFLGDLRPRSIWGGPLGDGKITISDTAALLMLALDLIKVEPAWKVVVEEERGIRLAPEGWNGGYDYQHYRIIKEDGQWKIAFSSSRWDLRGNPLLAKSFDQDVYGVFPDGTPIYDRIELTDPDTGDKFRASLDYAIGLEHLLDGIKKNPANERMLQELEGARFILGNGYSGTFLCAVLKDGSIKTLWIDPYDVLFILHGPLVEMPDGNVIRILRTEDGLLMQYYSFKPDYWGVFPKPREVATKSTSKTITLGPQGYVPDASLAGDKIIGIYGVRKNSILPDTLKVPIFDFQPRLPKVRFDEEESMARLILVFEPDSQKISLTDFRPKLAKEREKDALTSMDGPILVPRGLDESLLGLHKGEFLIAFEYAIYETKEKWTADSSLYPAHLEERLVER